MAFTWGGTKPIIQREVVPVIEKAGLPITSRKRWWGSWGSDHNRRQLRAYAIDVGTANNHKLKNRIYRRLTKRSRGSIADYAPFYIRRHGRTYRVQLIAGTHGTGPHLHIGIKRA